jgi:integrase
VSRRRGRGHIRPRTRANGTRVWDVKFSVHGEVHQKRGFLTQREADQYITEHLAAADKGRFVRPTNVKLGDYLWDEWLPAVESEVEATTFVNLRGHVRNHIAPFEVRNGRRVYRGGIGSIRSHQLTTERTKAFYGELLNKQRADGTGTLSKTTVQRIHATLHWALEALVDSGRLGSNPARKAKPRAKKSERRPELRYWTPEQLATWERSVSDSRLYALWRLLPWSGIRRGEAMATRLGDLDLDAGTLTICRAITVASYATHVTTPKSGKTRLIDLDPDTVTILRAFVTRLNQERLERGAGRMGDDDLLFVAKDGSPVHPDRVSKMFDASVRRYNRNRPKDERLRTIRLHDLRHTHASHLIDAGVNVKVISERLGHGSIQVTLDIYGHLLPTSQRQAVERLAAYYEERAS